MNSQPSRTSSPKAQPINVLGEHRQDILKHVALAILFLSALVFIQDNTTGQARLVIDFGGYQRIFEGEVISGTTVLEVLNASVVAGNIPLRFWIDPSGTTHILELNEHRDVSQDRGLLILINNRQISPAAIHKITVRDRDEIVMKLSGR